MRESLIHLIRLIYQPYQPHTRLIHISASLSISYQPDIRLICARDHAEIAQLPRRDYMLLNMRVRTASTLLVRQARTGELEVVVHRRARAKLLDRALERVLTVLVVVVAMPRQEVMLWPTKLVAVIVRAWRCRVASARHLRARTQAPAGSKSGRAEMVHSSTGCKVAVARARQWDGCGSRLREEAESSPGAPCMCAAPHHGVLGARALLALFLVALSACAHMRRCVSVEALGASRAVAGRRLVCAARAEALGVAVCRGPRLPTAGARTAKRPSNR